MIMFSLISTIAAAEYGSLYSINEMNAARDEQISSSAGLHTELLRLRDVERERNAFKAEVDRLTAVSAQTNALKHHGAS